MTQGLDILLLFICPSFDPGLIPPLHMQSVKLSLMPDDKGVRGAALIKGGPHRAGLQCILLEYPKNS